jgi:N-acetylglucosamine-6-phosphate deacetylase
MAQMYIFNGTVILPDDMLKDGVVLCNDGVIEAVGLAEEIPLPRDARTIDAGGAYIAPGFVDMHVHGALGHDFMDGTEEAVRQATIGHTQFGTTSIFPTTTTGRPDQIAAMLDACEAVSKAWKPGDHARIAGVHFYGPYFATDMVGAHPKGMERDPDPEEYKAAFARDIVRIATCAAELPGAEEFYRAAKAAGCLCTCGHSNATWHEMQNGFDVGLRHVDHFYCAMSCVPELYALHGHPMQGSMTEFVLFEKEMSTEVLADGEHLASELLEFAFTLKGPERLCLVTDANRAVGMPPGDYKIGSQENGAPFTSNGKVGLGPDGGLASTVVGMDHMVRHMVGVTSAYVIEAVRMASLTPAERVGVDDEIGSLEEGKKADVQILSHDLHTQRVFVEGVEFTIDR